MPKVQVYLPDGLYERVKAEGGRLNVSGVLQEALGERLAELERHDALAEALAAHAAESGPFALITHTGIVGQVWRSPARQARLAAALKAFDVRPLTIELAKAAGILLGATRTADVHDGALALLCEPEDVLYTSDVDDLTALLAERGATRVGIIRV